MTAKTAKSLGAAALLAICVASTQAAAQGVGGDVRNKCNIGAATVGVSKTALTTISDTGATLDFSGGASNSFGDGSGHGLPVSGNVELTLDTNTNCTVTLSSSNGALWNSRAAAVRNYTANAYDTSTPGTGVALNLNSHPAAPSGTFHTTPASTRVRIEFTVPGTGSQVLPAGTYTDTLTLTMSTS